MLVSQILWCTDRGCIHRSQGAFFDRSLRSRGLSDGVASRAAVNCLTPVLWPRRNTGRPGSGDRASATVNLCLLDYAPEQPSCELPHSGCRPAAGEMPFVCCSVTDLHRARQCGVPRAVLSKSSGQEQLRHEDLHDHRRGIDASVRNARHVGPGECVSVREACRLGLHT
jgi:hypothetical protein